jgi:maltose alpha-D-glucosyltransferase/alpha-amylase
MIMDKTAQPSDPQWYKDAIIYELHVRAFHDSNNDGYGDFRGLVEKLDYLQDLGVTALWLLPFYPSPLRDDGYDIADYYSVHQRYGTLEDFQLFVAEAHKRGLRVITELVINHTSDQHPWFQAARKAPPGSPERDFYVWSETDQKFQDARIIFLDTEHSNWAWDETAKSFYWHRFFSHQPDLNYDNPAVMEAVLDVMKFWLDMGVDGLRLDAIPYLIEREGTNCENLPETHQKLKQIRKALDERYDDRMLLAEANQWPADVLPYFGDGDECHMSFHFPVMPRMFMALRQEDRYPIIEILRKTPEIPPDCQWAIFLRNHDELTLEMVTDQERDYMYEQYAADPQARLNLGIRRRLAPLLDNSRRRIELMMSLLFSLPGTPVIYYGDELGMGDNIFLGDRDGVRTPMQWSADRNAGFSRADFARLFLPPIVDNVYNYQTVNVEMAQRDPSSLLNWTKRVLALRKQSKTFGRGSIEFLLGDNRKVLAYLRRYEDEVILCVANLSRFPQPIRLDLSEFNGYTPVEMFGRTLFPPIGELPYFTTLGPHGFYWFRLETHPESLVAPPQQTMIEEDFELPTVKVTSFNRMVEGQHRVVLEKNVLPDFITKQRWYGSKSRHLETVSIRDWAPLVTDESALSWMMIVELHFSSGKPEQYAVPVAIASGNRADEMLRNHSPHLLARITSNTGEGVLYDALTDDASVLRLLEMVSEQSSSTSNSGKLSGIQTSAFADLLGDASVSELDVRHSLMEQSNSSVFFGDRFIMKLFRRLEGGVNPDFEVGRFLTDETSFDRCPQVAGSLEYQPRRSPPATIAMLQQVVQNQGTGWELALGEISRYYERVSSRLRGMMPLEGDEQSPLQLSRSELPEEIFETVGPFLRAAGVLGRRTGEMHVALGIETDDPAFAREPWVGADSRALAKRLETTSGGAVADLRARQSELPDQVNLLGERVIYEVPMLINRVAALGDTDVTAAKTRVHGDYHLGQVLSVEGDFFILDFEGEPVRTLAERRAKDSPLRDVAGMLRSLDYAAFGGLFEYTHDRPDDFETLEPWARHWRRWTQAAFLREYLATVEGHDLVPADTAQFALLLASYTMEKAFYEVRYELGHRPTWTRIPLRGIVDLIEHQGG